MPMTRSRPCALLHRSSASCPRASLGNSLAPTTRPSSSSAATASELLWESTPAATPILASFPRPIYDVTSGRTTRRWGEHPSIESLPPVRSRPEGRSGQKSATATRLLESPPAGYRKLSARRRVHSRILTPGLMGGGPPGNRTLNLRIKSPLLCLIELATRGGSVATARLERSRPPVEIHSPQAWAYLHL